MNTFECHDSKPLKAIQERFNQIDTNADGLISKDELRTALNAQIGAAAASIHIDRVYAEMSASNERGQDADIGIDLKSFWNWYRIKANQIRIQQQDEFIQPKDK